MIKSFRHKPLKQFWKTGLSARIPPELRGKIRRILLALDDMEAVGDTDMAPWRLHPLKGDRKGQWALRVSGNYRITFRFADGDVHDVDLIDYH